jgi:mono/diheme cytochrome c family protein
MAFALRIDAGLDGKVKVKLLITFVLVAICAANAQEKGKPSSGNLAERGKYIVEQVAMCVECHTARDGNGLLLRTEYLKGAPVPVQSPPYSQIKWALKAPAIAGLPGYTEQEGIRLFTDGITRDGRKPYPPMPRYRLNRSDAEAVVAYLKSLQ